MIATQPKTRTTTRYTVRQVKPNTQGLHAVYTDPDGTTWTERAALIALAEVETTIHHAGGRKVARHDPPEPVLIALADDGGFDVCDECHGYAGPCKPGADALKVTHCLPAELIEARNAWANREGITELIVGGEVAP